MSLKLLTALAEAVAAVFPNDVCTPSVRYGRPETGGHDFVIQRMLDRKGVNGVDSYWTSVFSAWSPDFTHGLLAVSRRFYGGLTSEQRSLPVVIALNEAMARALKEPRWFN